MDGCSDIYWTNYTKETAQSWNCPSTKEQICSIIIFGECTVSRPFASKMHVVLPHLLTLQAGVRASDLFQEADLRAACLVAAQHLSPAPSVNSFKLCIWNCTGVISRSVPEWSFFFLSPLPLPLSFSTCSWAGRAGRTGRDEWAREEEGRICLYWVRHQRKLQHGTALSADNLITEAMLQAYDLSM